MEAHSKSAGSDTSRVLNLLHAVTLIYGMVQIVVISELFRVSLKRNSVKRFSFLVLSRRKQERYVRKHILLT